MEDIEEGLESFIVRKNIANPELLKIRRITAVPLLLCDILRAQTIDGEFFTVFNGKVEFRLCLLSGRIAGFISANKRRNVYLLDDGTACIELVVFNDMGRSWRKVTRYYKPELVGPLREVLESAESMRDKTNMILGAVFVVLGRISLFQGKMSVLGQSLFAQNGANRDMEIAFKDYLIKCYKAKDSD